VIRVIYFPFPFIDSSENRNSLYAKKGAYKEGYQKAYGEDFFGGVKEPIKQVKHLSRDILAGTSKSEYLAEVTITDSFSTFMDRDQEVVFEFSLPENAVITNLLLGPALQYQGQIAPRGAAEQTYVEQVNRRVDPALLEQVGPRQYRLRVFPVPATNDTANQRRREEVEGEVQRVQFTYLVMRETEGIPMPVFSQKHNILDTETKYNVQMNGELADLTANSSHIVDKKTIAELCTYNDTSSVNLSNTREVNLFVGANSNNVNCLTDNVTSSNNKVQIFIDTSYENKDVSMSSLLDELKNLSPEFYTNNIVEFIPYSSKLGKVKKITSSSDLPNQEDLTFFDKAYIDIAFGDVDSDTDIAIFLSGKAINFSTDNLSSNVKSKVKGKHIVIVHAEDRVPTYGPNTERFFTEVKSLTVQTDVKKALKSALLHQQYPRDQYYYGDDYWSVGEVETGTSSSSTVVTTQSLQNEDLEKVIWSSYIKNKNLTNKNISKDYLHKQAVNIGIVTPFSSYIALVNEAQQNRLDKLSGDGDRYTSEARFQVSQVRLRNPLSGGGSVFGGSTTGLQNSSEVDFVPSVSLNEARSSGVDASIKQAMSSMRSQAELFYNRNNFSYEGVCIDPVIVRLGESAVRQSRDADNTIDIIDARISTNTSGVCHDSAAAWAVQVPLSEGSNWCVDSSGKAIQTNVPLESNDFVCN